MSFYEWRNGMKKTKLIGTAALFLSGMLVFAGCGRKNDSMQQASQTAAASAADTQEQTEDLKVLHAAWVTDMQTMDVHKTTNNYSIPQNVFDRLLEVKLNEDGTTQLVNSLASDYTVSEDGLTYSFTLRDDVKFSDGTPLTSDDVLFTFTRMFTLPESVQTDFTTVIKGAQAVLDHEAETLEGIHVIDDTHFEILLEQPFAGFLAVLATPTCSIMSRANVESAGDDFGLVPEKTIGSGPYKVTQWTLNSSVTLERNPFYWGTPASADIVEIRIYPEASSLNMAFKNGDVDILDCEFIDASIANAEYVSNNNYRIVSVNRMGSDYLTFNEDIAPLDNLQVRRAIQMAIDRQSIIDSLFNGNASLIDGIYPVGAIGFTEENQGWLVYDPAQAKELLAEAGYADGFDLELSKNAAGGEYRGQVLEIVQQNLEAVGINARIVTYDESSWLDLRKSGEMPMFTATWTLDYNDPSNIIEAFFSSPETVRNRSLNYKDEAVMERIREARSIVNEEERLAEYAALEKKIVQEDAAWVPLYSPQQHMFVLSDRVESFTPHWAGFSDFAFAGVTMK